MDGRLATLALSLRLYSLNLVSIMVCSLSGAKVVNYVLHLHVNIVGDSFGAVHVLSRVTHASRRHSIISLVAILACCFLVVF